MQFPKLTPLQARLLACLGTSVLLVIIYYYLSPVHFAYAAEISLDTIHNEDHNHRRILGLSPDDLAPDVGWEERIGGVGLEETEYDERGQQDGETAGYQAEFFGADRSIIGRAMADVTALQNTAPSNLNIKAGQTNYYIFENSTVWGPLAGKSGNDIMSNITGDAMLVKRLLGHDWERQKYHIEEYEEYEENVNGSKELRLRKRQTGALRQVYITINTCLQPEVKGTLVGDMPQLTLYISTTDSNPKPGPGANEAQQMAIQLEQGYAGVTVNATGNVYIGVSAPSVGNNSFSIDTWNYDISASIDSPYFYCNDSPQLFLHYVDSDSTSALLTTGNLTDLNATESSKELMMNMTSSFSLYVFDKGDSRIEGIRNSFCGLSKLQMNNSITVNGTMTRRGFNAIPKQQFYIDALAPGSSYTAILGYSGQNLSQVWNAKDFQTKNDGNCKLIYDLPFCTNIAYSVPTNGNLSMSDLRSQYDLNTSLTYTNFDASLQQIACNTTSSAQYSLVRNCTDCARDYKNWLCAVMIPRCTDFSDTSSYLAPRNVNNSWANGTMPDLTATGLNASMTTITRYNSSRNPFIDDVIKPLPYKEVLPCKELCYELVKSCPASLGFGCPMPDFMMQRSYGELNTTALQQGVLTCNYPGVDVPDMLGVAVSVGPAIRFAMAVSAVVMGVMALV